MGLCTFPDSVVPRANSSVTSLQGPVMRSFCVSPAARVCSLTSRASRLFDVGRAETRDVERREVPIRTSVEVFMFDIIFQPAGK